MDNQLNEFEKKREAKRRELGFQPDETVAVVFGRLVSWKGQEIFIRAMSEAARQNPMFTGLIVGHDSSAGQKYLTELKALARELKIESRIKFLGFQEDVWPLYAAADIVIHASTQPEPFGLVILEAMFAGKPVIATRGGGVTDMVIDRKTGLLVEAGDARQLAEAMIRLQQERQLADLLIHNAKERARKLFTMEKNAARVSEIYEELLRTKA